MTDVDRLAAETGFSGVVRIDTNGTVAHARAYGLADRANGVPNTLDTRFGIASGTKGLTALTVASLVEDGTLSLDTTARALLGDDLPLIAPDVTVWHLLAHRSGIGDYADEETEPPLTVPVDRLDGTEDYLAALAGHATKFAAGERFSYCNGGYVVLALLAERAARTPFRDLVAQRVCEPAGLTATGFPRADELPGGSAFGYLEGHPARTNVYELPVRGSGDGGAYSTAADVHRLWAALFAGRIARPELVTTPVSDVPAESMRYGLGFWLHESRDQVILIGYDKGVSFYSRHDPAAGDTITVIGNTAAGAWPLVKALS
ncbi:serine hydrolase domain-containing protein [Amycolatopsis suaedae]|uniref:Class A beta-lactamase-related serine hydrolase n=1 Tax=Amycolatopsis suaedae TaxID=2510978 RepID=A0A4Q7JDD5_9PSEU|nr:serine hydrolase domain-containing protein [Amycolatopsis suaedae]RZQ65178.1 class A beta-lactamase-related serine hydrolase [Amycolatopsis suaedae]